MTDAFYGHLNYLGLLDASVTTVTVTSTQAVVAGDQFAEILQRVVHAVTSPLFNDAMRFGVLRSATRPSTA